MRVMREMLIFITGNDVWCGIGCRGLGQGGRPNCERGMTLEEAKRRMGAGAEAQAETGIQWWVGKVVYMVVDTQRATESLAGARADRIRKTDSDRLEPEHGKGKEDRKEEYEKRAMHEPAVRASRFVIAFGEPGN